MIYTPTTHKFVATLESEVANIKAYLKNEGWIPEELQSAFDEVDEELKVFFDDADKPYAEPAMESLKDLLNELEEKYSGIENDLTYAVKRIKAGVETGAPMGEDVFCPILRDNHYFNSTELQIDADRLAEAFPKAHEGYTIEGGYSPVDHSITLFTGNIGEDPLRIAYTFAHEFFHAVHCHLLKKTNQEPLCQYYHCVILESLAKYFQIEYIRAKGTLGEELARKELLEVGKYTPVFYPYSGAKYMTYMRADEGTKPSGLSDAQVCEQAGCKDSPKAPSSPDYSDGKATLATSYGTERSNGKEVFRKSLFSFEDALRALTKVPYEAGGYEADIILKMEWKHLIKGLPGM